MLEDEDVLGLETAEDVSRAAERLYGAVPVEAGVVHVTAVWRRGSRLVTIEIRQDTPRCHHDFFALNLARARADAVLTTGKILREEPGLSHGLQGQRRVAEALAEWRREVLGKTERPWSLVLTSGRRLDLGHPLFAGETRGLIYTGLDAAERLREAAAARGVEVVGREEPSPADAVRVLRERFGAKTISIEAGPSVSLGLYEEPSAVDSIDEVALSVFEGELAEELRGGEYLSEERLEALLPRRAGGAPVETAAGPWRFFRYRR